MEKEHINSELEQEELTGEVPSVSLPDEPAYAYEVDTTNGTPFAEQHAEDNKDETEEDASRSGDDEDGLNIPDVLPILPLKDTVVYPFAVQPLGVGQERSIRLIDDVMRGNRLVVLVAQKSAEIEQ